MFIVGFLTGAVVATAVWGVLYKKLGKLRNDAKQELEKLKAKL